MDNNLTVFFSNAHCANCLEGTIKTLKRAYPHLAVNQDVMRKTISITGEGVPAIRTVQDIAEESGQECRLYTPSPRKKPRAGKTQATSKMEREKQPHIPHSNHKNFRHFLLLGTFSLTLMTLMLLGVTFSPLASLLLCGLAGVCMAMYSKDLFKEAWLCLLGKHPLTINVFFAFSAGLCLIFSVIATLGVAVPFCLDMALMLLSTRHLGIWLHNRLGFQVEESWSLFDNMPTHVKLITDDQNSTDIPTTAIKKGEIITVEPGTIPVDGVLVNNSQATINTQAYTGKNIAEEHKAGDKVYAGCTSHNTITIETTCDHTDSELVDLFTKENQPHTRQDRLNTKSSTFDRWLEKLLRQELVFILLFAVFTTVLWAFINPSVAIFAAISVMLISCPCVLAITIPLMGVTTSNKASQYGIYFKNASAIIALAQTDTLYIDKTGTLTQLYIKDLTYRDENSLTQWDADATPITLPKSLTLLYALEKAAQAQRKKGPYANAILQTLGEQEESNQVHDFKFVRAFNQPEKATAYNPIKGLCGEIDGQQIWAGNVQWVCQTLPALTNIISGLNLPSNALVWANNAAVLGHITFREDCKPSAMKAIEKLRKFFKHIIGLSGDTEDATKATMKKLGIEDFQHSQTPKTKQEAITKSQALGNNTAMMGDGINDLLAQQKSNCGIGYDQDKKELDVILADHSPWQLYQAKVLARQCYKAIKVALGFSLAYNLVGIFLAAGGFLLLTGMMMNPMIAAAMMIGSFFVLTCIAYGLKALSVPAFQNDSINPSPKNAFTDANTSFMENSHKAKKRLDFNNQNTTVAAKSGRYMGQTQSLMMKAS